MRSRAIRVAFLHLSQNEEMPNQTEDVLNELEIRDTSEEALDDYFPAILQQNLRKLEIGELLAVVGEVVKNFHSSDTPSQLLNQKLKPLKNVILKALEEVAKGDSKSIKDSIFEHFQKEPTSDSEEVTDFTRSWLSGIVKKIKEKKKRIEKL